MWELLTRYFQRFPAQSRVAQTLLVHGFSVREDGVYSGNVAISDTALARACEVDRRIISATVETIRREPELMRFYTRLGPTCHLKDAAPIMGWGVIEIIPSDAREPGILAHLASVLARRGISIRQAIVDDPELVEEPRLYVITEQRVPGDVIEEIRAGHGVKGVTIS
ncbi:MAG TPA: ACT domain-containing protein [Candidatus Thermoplasmatota archaeon]|nr:ACT domain-containing protein [Candidatus Thermoplasmatota archaeon]